MNEAPQATLAAWRARGGQHVDPARFGYLEALARRTEACQGEARDALDARLAHALADYGARLEQARSEARDALALQAARLPQAAPALQRLHAEGRFQAQHRLAARLEAQARTCGLLAGLAHPLDRAAPVSDAASPAPAPSEPAELNTLTQFKSTWARLRVDQQLSRSRAQVPDNPGPLNSHLLVLRALRLMQELSPAYLEGFVAQLETLLWLDAAQGASPPPGGRPGSRPGPPPVPRRGRSKAA